MNTDGNYCSNFICIVSNDCLPLSFCIVTTPYFLTILTGLNGLYYILQVINKLLDPKTSEFTATFVGRLVTVLITRLGSRLADNLDLMLRAVLSKLQQAETLSVIQVK